MRGGTLGAMKKKLPAAVELGQRGGKARARKRTHKELSTWARKAAQARWQKARGKC